MYNSCAQLYSNSTQAPAIICWYLALCDVCLCYECSHNPKVLRQCPHKYLRLTCAARRTNPSTNYLDQPAKPCHTVPYPNLSTQTARRIAGSSHLQRTHTNKGSRYDLARGWCINTPVMFMRRQWRRILYACTPIMLNIEPPMSL